MWIDTLREWTQTMYGLIHSVKLSSAVDMGNINREEIPSVYQYFRNKVEAVACTDKTKWAQ